MSSYSDKAQPFLDAIAAAIFAGQGVRDWLVAGTRAEAGYTGASSLHDLQYSLRPSTKQPFYVNYWCGRDSRCSCRPPESTGLETDLMAFLRSANRRVLALHLEFKHPRERLGHGQALAYRLRAACWCSGDYRPRTVMRHDDWLTAIVCDPGFHPSTELDHFDKVISHREAPRLFEGYPDGL